MRISPNCDCSRAAWHARLMRSASGDLTARNGVFMHPRLGRCYAVDHDHWSQAMPFSSKRLVALTCTAAVLAPVAADAQTISPTNAPESTGTAVPPKGASQLTGKERLGGKWKDEQRIDNCKVPLDKRGTKPRPDSCAHAPSG